MVQMTRDGLYILKEKLLDDITDKAPEWARRVAVSVFEHDGGKKCSLICIVRTGEGTDSKTNFICKEWKGEKLTGADVPRKWLRANGIAV